MCFKLNSGYEIPKIVVGTWELTDNENLPEILDEALLIGYTAIDTARIYNNEHIIGEWLEKQKREKVFITTKLWNDAHDNVSDAIDESLRKLRTNYVDLYLIHWPVNSKNNFDLEKVWKQMEKLVESKKARSIGVSNFGIKNLSKLLKFCKIKPAVNQIELHPYLPQCEIREFCKKNDIQIEAYSPLGSSGNKEHSLPRDKIINEIAREYSTTPHQIILSFLNKQDLVVIPRTCSKEHLKSNFHRIDLKPSDIEKIKKITTRCRYINAESFGEHRFD